MDAGLDHLLGILGLRALDDGPALLHCDLLLQKVTVVETDSLVKGYWLLVLVLDLTFHASVFVTVIAHLVPALVLLGSRGFCVNSVTDADEGSLELLPRNAAISIGVEFLHEHLDLLLEGREAVHIEQHLLDLLSSDVPAVILVEAAEAGLELIIGEDVDANSVNEGRLELVRGSQRRYTEECHFIYLF